MKTPLDVCGVLIPFYKNKEQLQKCVASLGGKVKHFVKDDSETENGFTKTVNSLLKESVYLGSSVSGYVVVLNQDCYLKPDAVENMVSFMDEHPRCAIAGIKQLSDKDEDQIIHGGTRECFPTGIHEIGLVSRGDCNKEKQVPWVNGACMIVRLEALLEIGLMDPNYKMFGSDADWGYTARARNWECWYIPQAVCVHEQGVSKGQDEKMGKIFQSDMRYFRDKWLVGELYKDLSLEVF